MEFDEPIESAFIYFPRDSAEIVGWLMQLEDLDLEAVEHERASDRIAEATHIAALLKDAPVAG